MELRSLDTPEIFVLCSVWLTAGRACQKRFAAHSYNWYSGVRKFGQVIGIYIKIKHHLLLERRRNQDRPTVPFDVLSLIQVDIGPLL